MRVSNLILVATVVACALGCKPSGKTKSPGLIDAAAEDVGSEIGGAGQSAEGVGDDIGGEVEGAAESAEGVGDDVGKTVSGKDGSPPPAADDNAAADGG